MSHAGTCKHATERFSIVAAVVLVVAAACLIVTARASAQDPPPRTIRRVEFLGLRQTSQTLARDIARIAPGDPLEPAALDAAVTRLLRTRRFLAATWRVVDLPDGVQVVFDVREHPTVTAIRFEGNRKFAASHLLKEVLQKKGEPVDWFAIRDGRESIVAMYREAGYGDVTVSYDRDRVSETGELVFVISEGKQVRIRKIRFEGNEAFPDRALKRWINTKKAFWIFRTGAFDEDRVEADVVSIQNHYRDEGFLDATATYRRELSENGKDLTIIFVVEEGTRYAVESIEFSGHSVFSAEELLALMTSEVGETVKRRQVEADARAIQTRYGTLGYLYAEVRPIRVFSDEPGLVRITIQINEQDQYRVGEVRVRGNTRTKDKVVRRALNLYPPDDLFDLSEAREAERRLVDTRIFSSARVYPVGDAPGVRDVVIDVQEAERLGDFLFGVGVTSNSGLVGNVVLDLRNFDLFDTPRTWKEFIKFRAFFGAGQRMRLEFQPGTEVNRFRIDFSEPYFMDKPLRLDVSGYLFDRGRDGYSERRAGASVSVGKRFEQGLLHGWSGEVAFRLENTSLRDLELFAARDIRKYEGANLLTGVKTALVRDRTDSRYVPTSGDRLRLSYEQFAGEHTFGRATARYTWYKTVHTDLYERKSVVQLKAEGGAIIGDAPVFQRFYAGGTGSIRGFDFRGVGERQGLQDNNIGGDYLALLAGEYSFPLYGDNLRGLFFIDSGTAGSGVWRTAIGTGVRFTIQVFGPVPLELDLAIPVLRDDDDEEQIFSFQIGSLF
ncbi:MAG: outer membrane protein assembly factor BamA [Phycisphaerae bacterium]